MVYCLIDAFKFIFKFQLGMAKINHSHCLYMKWAGVTFSLLILNLISFTGEDQRRSKRGMGICPIVGKQVPF